MRRSREMKKKDISSTDFLIVNYIEVFLQIIDRVNPRHTSNIFGILSADRCALSRQIIKLQTINQFLLIAETLILKLKR